VGGVCKVVDRLQDGLKHIHLSSTILSIQPDSQDPKSATLTISVNGEVVEHPGFHHIVFATQAPAAASMLTTYINSLPDTLAHRKEKILPLIQCLKTFQTRPSVVINHTDDSLLPDNDRDIRELNLITVASGTNLATSESKAISLFHVRETYTMATQVLRGPKEFSRAQPHIFQSTNPLAYPRRESIMSIANLERAVVTKESKKALGLLSEQESRKWWQCPYQATMRPGPLQGCRPLSEHGAPGIWVCGAFAHTGIPLLEGCVVSAQNVVQQGIFETEGINWKEEPYN
jgi:microfibrillar-associated protein 1